MLYIGVTNNLERSVWEHKQKIVPGFTAKFKINRLLYFEAYDDIRDAIAREKQLKSWRREKKLDLIERMNYGCADLSAGWYGGPSKLPR